jgi:hypothetical protein
MHWETNKFNNRYIDDKDYYSLQHTEKTFKALVDAIIPRTPKLAKEYGEVQYFGALDLYIYEYVILSLNNYNVLLAKSIAKLVDAAAERLVLINQNKALRNFSEFNEKNSFIGLSVIEQFKALTLLKYFTIHFEKVSTLFQDNSEFIVSIDSILSRYTIMGYYSEWSGYGNTRLNTPNQRILESYPLSWKQIGYPGPSIGYRALRK